MCCTQLSLCKEITYFKFHIFILRRSSKKYFVTNHVILISYVLSLRKKIYKSGRWFGEILKKDHASMWYDQSSPALKSLTPCTRQIRGPLCSTKLDFDIDDLCTLTLHQKRKKGIEPMW